MALSKIKLVCALEAASELKEPKNRNIWVSPFYAKREANKKFWKLYKDIRKYEEKFFGYCRISISLF